MQSLSVGSLILYLGVGIVLFLSYLYSGPVRFDSPTFGRTSSIQSKEQMETPIFVLHGLGERTWTMGLFKFILKHWGWRKVYTPHWPADTCLLEDCLDHLDREMQHYARKSDPIFIIGNSMGGVMAYHLHTRGWNIIASYSIAAPINGSAMYRWLKETLPSGVFEFSQQPGYLYLERTEQPPIPPHPWYTIGYNFAFGFDGNVFLTDMPSENHITLPGAHNFLLFDPLTWYLLDGQMRQQLVNNSS